MENQHKLIKGFRDLTQVEIDLMNRIKEHGKELGELVDAVRLYTAQQQLQADRAMTAQSFGCQAELNRLASADPARWVEVGATNLQQGLMALTRAVAQPTFF